MSRLPARVRNLGTRIVGSIPVRIQAGPNAGCRWSLASSGRGYRAGTFESARVDAIVSLLRPGDNFWDIGAHKGYLSLAASRAVGPRGSVLALEPSLVNQALLRRHMRWNDAGNVRILPLAVSDTNGVERFGGSGSSITYRLGQGDDSVPTRTIRSLIGDDRHTLPDVVKIDAEGSEAAILRGGIERLSSRTLVWISVHSHALFAECRSLLLGRSFRVFESAEMLAVTTPAAAAWGGDKELLAVGADHELSEDALRGLRLFGA